MPRESVRKLVESAQFQRFIVAVILVNAVVLGAETSDSVMAVAGGVVNLVDAMALGIFVVEMLLKMYAYGVEYFRDPWNCFDFLVIGVALLPASGGLSVLRAFRILRVLRLVSATPSMRKVVANLLAALPGMGSILGLLALVLYVAAVMATKLFGAVTPEYFGSLGTSMWTLFQIMTGEAWPDIARTVMDEKPLAWIFFLLYILVSTFVVLNLFLAVMVSAAEDVRAAEQPDRTDAAAHAAILAELAALRAELHALHPAVTSPAPTRPRARRDLDDTEIAHAVTLYRQGQPLARIADRIGVPHTTIRDTLQRHRVLRHNPHARHR
ncbi:ion transporter [Nocardia crassostreae]|uniref:ion transporter n=1 Tax=Nocardia crassostreae TaxID=53428 RepID=UPI00082C66B9|nr:ion transporter [Nocardia crassostreae]